MIKWHQSENWTKSPMLSFYWYAECHCVKCRSADWRNAERIFDDCSLKHLKQEKTFKTTRIDLLLKNIYKFAFDNLHKSQDEMIQMKICAK